MIDLRVNLSRQFVDLCTTGTWRQMRDRIAEFIQGPDFISPLQMADVLDLQDLPSKAACRRIRATADFLAENATRSVAQLQNILPTPLPQTSYELTVELLPFGRFNFGPRGGLQVFSLYPEADPREAYLFLVHVYYHELSPLFYTTRCARCSDAQNNVDDFIYWIKLLVRNEGIANYLVFNDLVDFMERNPRYEFRYFTYARQIGDDDLVRAGVAFLNRLFEQLDEGEFSANTLALVHALKSKVLPIINLLGIHMGCAIVACFGQDVLRDVYQRSPDEFFQRYAETGMLSLGALAQHRPGEAR